MLLAPPHPQLALLPLRTLSLCFPLPAPHACGSSVFWASSLSFFFFKPPFLCDSGSLRILPDLPSMGTGQRPCRVPGNGHLAQAWCQAALPAPDTTGLVACLSPAALGHGVRWGGSDWWMRRQGPTRPKLVTSLLDISTPSLP